MERAERKGSALRRLLRSADRFSEAAIALGSLLVNTPSSSVSASLCSVTTCDHRRPPPRRTTRALLPRLLAFRALTPRRFDAVAFLAMGHPHRTDYPAPRFNAPGSRRFLMTKLAAARLAPAAREVGEWRAMKAQSSARAEPRPAATEPALL